MAISDKIANLAQQIEAQEQAVNSTLTQAANRISDCFAGRQHRMDAARMKLAVAQKKINEGNTALAEALAEITSLEMEAAAEGAAIGADILTLRYRNTPRMEREARDDDDDVRGATAAESRKLKGLTIIDGGDVAETKHA